MAKEFGSFGEPTPMERLWLRVKGLAQGFGGFIRKKPLGGLGLFLLLIILVMAAFAEFIAPEDPIEQFPRTAPTSENPFGDPLRLMGPFTTVTVLDRSTPAPLDTKRVFFLLGTDNLSRDLFSRLVFGARAAVRLSLSSVLIGSLIGVFLGLVSGYYGGKLDMLIQRIVDAWMSIPALVLALAIVGALGASTWTIIFAISAFVWPSVARVIRAVTLSVKEQQFVDAARAIGASNARIMFRHVLPQTMAPLIIMTSSLVGAAIVIEAALAFLGLGVPAPQASWGQMLSGQVVEFIREEPLVVVWPGLFITIAVFGANLLGDSLRDVLDPRLRAR